MNLFKFLIIFIFFFCCNTEPIRKEITVGKTIKIEPSNFDTKVNNNYNFLWSKPQFSGENNKQSMQFKIENNKMLFTPLIEGNFDISLIDEAKEYQSKLKNNGFDAYTEPLTLKNKQYWRVRVGNFTDYNKAKDVEKLLKELKYDTWFTNIK